MTWLLAGCGEVVVFGHVVREANKSIEVKADAQVAAPTTSTTVSSATTTTTATETAGSVQPEANSSTAKMGAKAGTETDTNTSAKTAPAVVGKSEKRTAIQHVKAVTLSFTPEIMEKVSKDSLFDAKALLDAVNSELQSRGLVATDKQATPTLSIYIDNYDMHANTNFVMFGSTPHTGTLAGNLSLRVDEDEAALISHVETYSRISVPDNGQSKDLLLRCITHLPSL